jgi:hypothetical protein
MDRNAIVSKTASEAFPSGPQLEMENFAGMGSVQQGDRTVANILSDEQKSLQESYRSGLSKSASCTEGVVGR